MGMIIHILEFAFYEVGDYQEQGGCEPMDGKTIMISLTFLFLRTAKAF